MSSCSSSSSSCNAPKDDRHRATVSEFFESLNLNYDLGLPHSKIQEASLNVRAQLITYGDELLFAEKALLEALEVPELLIHAIHLHSQGVPPSIPPRSSKTKGASGTLVGCHDNHDAMGIPDEFKSHGHDSTMQTNSTHSNHIRISESEYQFDSISEGKSQTSSYEHTATKSPVTAAASSSSKSFVKGRNACPLCPARLVTPEHNTSDHSSDSSLVESGWQVHLAGLGYPSSSFIESRDSDQMVENFDFPSPLATPNLYEVDGDEEKGSRTQVHQPGSGAFVGKVDYLCISGPHGVYALKECLHVVCGKCLVDYISAQIDSGKVLDFSCPVPGCKVSLDPAQFSDILPKAEHERYEEAMLHALISVDGVLTECPKCKSGISIAAVDISPTEPITEKRSDGKLFSREAFVHFKKYRVRCTCGQVFCGQCKAKDYHPGYTCESWKDYLHAPQCRFCGDKLIERENKVLNPISPSLAKVCTKEECTERASLSCTRTLPCGCSCKGLRGELICPPCLDCELGVGDDFCSICYVEPKKSAPCIRSGVNLFVNEFSRNALNPKMNEIASAINPFTAASSYIKAYQSYGEEFIAKPSVPPSLVSSEIKGAKDHVSSSAVVNYIMNGCEANLPPLIPGLTKPQNVCKHVHHYHCVVQRLASKWPQARIGFAFRSCPDCRLPIYHPSLDPLIQPVLALEQYITSKAIARLEYEGKLNDEPLITKGSPMYNDFAAYAMSCFVFYQCYNCKLPYFGGGNRCQDASAGYDPAELVCPPCQATISSGGSTSKTECKTHGTEWLGHKCRFCCNLSTWSCWGNTHFCDVCHKSGVWQGLVEHRTGKNKKCIWDYPQCDSLQVQIRLLQSCSEWGFWTEEVKMEKLSQLRSDPSKCPLKVAHPPTGFEFSLGCTMCSTTSQISESKLSSGKASGGPGDSLEVQSKSIIPADFRSEFGLSPVQTIMPHILVNLSSMAQLYIEGKLLLPRNRRPDLKELAAKEAIVQRLPFLKGMQFAETANENEGNLAYSMRLKWNADFDQNGLFYLLGSQFYTRPWVNPAQLGFVTCKSSKLAPNSLPPEGCLSRGVCRCVTESDSKAYFEIELHGGIEISVDSYTLRHYDSFDGECLRNWILYGGHDGIKWYVVMAHKNDTSLDGIGSTHTWTTRTPKRGPLPSYSKFRLEITGPNSNGNYFLPVSGIEFYGKVTIPTPQTLAQQLEAERTQSISALQATLTGLKQSDLDDLVTSQMQLGSRLLPDMFEVTRSISSVIESEAFDVAMRNKIGLEKIQNEGSANLEKSSFLQEYKKTLYKDFSPVQRSRPEKWIPNELIPADINENINNTSNENLLKLIPGVLAYLEGEDFKVETFKDFTCSERSAIKGKSSFSNRKTNEAFLPLCEVSLQHHSLQATGVLLNVSVLISEEPKNLTQIESVAKVSAALSRLRIFGKQNALNDSLWFMMDGKFRIVKMNYLETTSQSNSKEEKRKLTDENREDIEPMSDQGSIFDFSKTFSNDRGIWVSTTVFCPFTLETVKGLLSQAKRKSVKYEQDKDQVEGGGGGSKGPQNIPLIQEFRIVLNADENSSLEKEISNLITVSEVELYGRLWRMAGESTSHSSFCYSRKEENPPISESLNHRLSLMLQIENSSIHKMRPLDWYQLWIASIIKAHINQDISAFDESAMMSVRGISLPPFPDLVDFYRYNHFERPAPSRIDFLMHEKVTLSDERLKQYRESQILRKINNYRKRTAFLSSVRGISQLQKASWGVLQENASAHMNESKVLEDALVSQGATGNTMSTRNTGFIDVEEEEMEEVIQSIMSMAVGNMKKEAYLLNDKNVNLGKDPLVENAEENQDSQSKKEVKLANNESSIITNSWRSINDSGTSDLLGNARKRRSRFNPGVLAFLLSSGFKCLNTSDQIEVKDMIPCLMATNSKGVSLGEFKQRDSEDEEDLIALEFRSLPKIRARHHYTMEGLRTAIKLAENTSKTAPLLLPSCASDMVDMVSLLKQYPLPTDQLLLARGKASTRTSWLNYVHDASDSMQDENNLPSLRIRSSPPFEIAFGSSPLKPARYVSQPIYEADMKNAIRMAELRSARSKCSPSMPHPLHNPAALAHNPEEHHRKIAEIESTLTSLPRITPALGSCSPTIAKYIAEGAAHDLEQHLQSNASADSSMHAYAMHSALATLIIPPSVSASRLAYFHPKRFVTLPTARQLNSISGAVIAGGLSGFIRGAPYVLVDLGPWVRLKLSHYSVQSAGVGMVLLPPSKSESHAPPPFEYQNNQDEKDDDSSSSDESEADELEEDENIEAGRAMGVLRAHDGEALVNIHPNEDPFDELNDIGDLSSSDCHRDENKYSIEGAHRIGGTKEKSSHLYDSAQKNGENEDNFFIPPKPIVSRSDTILAMSDVATEGISSTRASEVMNAAAMAAAANGATPEEAAAAGVASLSANWQAAPQYRVCESADDDGGRAYIRNWQIIGSVDGRSWDLLSIHVDDRSLDAPGATRIFQCQLPMRLKASRLIESFKCIRELGFVRDSSSSIQLRHSSLLWSSTSNMSKNSSTKKGRDISLNPEFVAQVHESLSLPFSDDSKLDVLPPSAFGYRFFALVMSGPNSLSGFSLSLSALELYGDMLTSIPTSPECKVKQPISQALATAVLPPFALSTDAPQYTPASCEERGRLNNEGSGSAITSQTDVISEREIDLVCISRDAMLRGVTNETISFLAPQANPFLINPLVSEEHNPGESYQAKKAIPSVINLALNEEELLSVGIKYLHGKGCFSHLGSDSKGSWINPYLLGKVSITSSSLQENVHKNQEQSHVSSSQAWEVLGLGYSLEAAKERRVGIVTEANTNAQIALDLGCRMRMRVTHYALALSSEIILVREAPRSWMLEGSTNATLWEPIRVHEFESALHKENQVAIWRTSPIQGKIDLCKDPDSIGYRYFRLRLLGPNANDHWILAISGFELYGVLFEYS